MKRNVWVLFLSISSMAWGSSAMDKENIFPNFQSQTDRTFEKDQTSIVPEKRSVSPIDNRTPEEIEKRIDLLESQLAAYRSFNQDHHEIIKQLKGLNFFENSFPNGNTDVLTRLESVFTNNHGEGGAWGYVVRELDRRPQRFIKRFDQLVEDVTNKESEKNPEIRKLLDQIYSEIGPVSLMIIYYLKNKA